MTPNQDHRFVEVTFDNFYNPEKTLILLKSIGGKYIKSFSENNSALIEIYFTKISHLKDINGVLKYKIYNSPENKSNNELNNDSPIPQNQAEMPLPDLQSDKEYVGTTILPAPVENTLENPI